MKRINHKEKSKMKMLVKLIILFAFTIVCTVGCGKAMTEKQYNQLWADYQEDKIDEGYYDLATDAYDNGEPMPSKLWYKIKTIFTNLGLLIVGFAVIGGVIFIIKKSTK